MGLGKKPTQRWEFDGAFAKRLTRLCGERDLDKGTMAEMMGKAGYPVTRQAIGKWLDGRTEPLSRFIVPLARVLQVPVYRLLTGRSRDPWRE